MKNDKKIWILVTGFVVLVVDYLGASFYKAIIEKWGWNEIFLLVAVVFLFIIGITLIVIALVRYFKDIERMDVENYFSEDNNVKFDLKHQFDEYRKTFLPKVKDKNGNPISKKYSTWTYDLLKKYNAVGSNKETKRSITVDMQHYLKSVKRTVDAVDYASTSVLVPAELGLVSIVCASKELGSVIAAIIFTLVICILFAITLRVNYKIRCFVEDVADVLNISLDGNKEVLVIKTKTIKKEKTTSKSPDKTSTNK